MIRYERKEKYKKPLNIKELLLIALDREDASVGFYEDMTGHIFLSKNTKDFIRQLQKEEEAHKLRIEKKLQELKGGRYDAS